MLSFSDVCTSVQKKILCVVMGCGFSFSFFVVCIFVCMKLWRKVTHIVLAWLLKMLLTWCKNPWLLGATYLVNEQFFSKIQEMRKCSVVWPPCSCCFGCYLSNSLFWTKLMKVPDIYWSIDLKIKLLNILLVVVLHTYQILLALKMAKYYICSCCSIYLWAT